MRRRLETLRASGAEVFDGPGFRFIETLLERAEGLDGVAGEHLRRRAAERLSAFEAAFASARAEARATLATLDAADADPDGDFARAFASADYGFVRREAPRALRRARTDDADAARARVVRLARQARSRGLTLQPALRASVHAVTAPQGAAEADGVTLSGPAELSALRTVGDQLARALFREAADHARSALVVARASDRVAEDVGPYNPEALAARTLALVEALSPGYLRATLAGLEDLAALRRLPEPKARRRRRR